MRISRITLLTLILALSFGMVSASVDLGNNVEFVPVGTSLGIGTTTPATSLEVNGTVTATLFNGSGAGLTDVVATVTVDSLDFTDFKDTMSLDTSTNITMENGDLNFDSDTFVIDSSANMVGIGTNVPGDEVIDTASASVGLEISSNTDPSIQIRNVSDSAGLDMWLDSSTSIAYFDSRRDLTTTSAGFRFRTRTDGDSQTVMSITGNGNVGINTATPSTYLQVSSDNEEEDIVVFGAKGRSQIVFSDEGVSTNHYYSKMKLLGNTSVGGQRSIGGLIEGYSAQDTYDASSAVLMFDAVYNSDEVSNADLFSWRENGSLHMVMNAAGNLGIGEATPATPLEVSGTITATLFNGSGAGLTDVGSDSLEDDSLNFDKFKDTMSLDTTTNITMENGDLNFDSDTFVIDSSANNVGIGDSSPEAKLKVNGTVLSTAQFTTELYSNTSAATIVVDWNNGNKQTVILNQVGHTVNFTNPTAGVGSVTLMLVQDGTGSRTVTTWDTDIKWPSGLAPTLSTSAAAVDILSCLYNGTYYYCQTGIDFQ